MKLLVTGGCGFIGSALIRFLVRETDAEIVNVDKLTYAATPEALEEAADSPRYVFAEHDICDHAAMTALFETHRPDAVLHLAAESHVDRSIDGPDPFVQTNVIGTVSLLRAAQGYHAGLAGDRRAAFRFHHVSTDEVYGSLGLDDPAFTETTRYDPRSPYSASKAASDHFVRAWGETYGLPVVMSNCSNNYGPWQFPEKLIPLVTIKAVKGERLPVYGAGENVRDWLHVEDHARALWLILSKAPVGASFNVGGDAERRNIEVVRAICALLDARRPEGAPHDRLIEFVEDRPGHDLRYAIDFARIARELNWRPAHSFETGLAGTVDWYLQNQDWWSEIMAGRYDGARLGTGKAGAPG